MTPGPKPENVAQVAYPMIESDGFVSGWFRFQDEYLSPEVRYSSYPTATTIKIGGRTVQIDRPVSIKIRLLDEDEDRHFWCNKKQHSQRVNLNEYHSDFGDVEVAYSFSSPQTHIWFCGYTIHTDCFENLVLSSYNVTVRIVPEHVIPADLLMQSPEADLMQYGCGTVSKMHRSKRDELAVEDYVITGGSTLPVGTTTTTSTDMAQNKISRLGPEAVRFRRFDRGRKSLFELAVDEGRFRQHGGMFPLYSAYVPKRVQGISGVHIDMVAVPEHMNDCDREFILRNAFDVGVPVSQISNPVSCPPVYPPVQPYEHPALVHSYMYNNSLARHGRMFEMELFFKEMVRHQRRKEYLQMKKQEMAVMDAQMRYKVEKFSDPQFVDDCAFPIRDVHCEDFDDYLKCRRKVHKMEKRIANEEFMICEDEPEQHHHHHRTHRRRSRSISAVLPVPDDVDSTHSKRRPRVEKRSPKSYRYPDRDYEAVWDKNCWDPEKAIAAYNNLTTRLVQVPRKFCDDQADENRGDPQIPQTVGGGSHKKKKHGGRPPPRHHHIRGAQ